MVLPVAPTTPFNRVVWPDQYALNGVPQVWDVQTATSLPSVGRALQVYTGMAKQMAMDAYRGIDLLPRPRLLDRPDPDRARSWYVQVQVEDYLLHGNALSYVTSWNAEGWPASVLWLPASWVSVGYDPAAPWGLADYWVNGAPVDASRVIHVMRGADRLQPNVGVGVVEQHLATLDRVASEDAYQSSVLNGSAVPSVAVIAPNPRLSQEEADQAADSWVEKYGGPVRRPAILPNGTQVIPLAWSPTDAQMVEARRMSLQDVANAFNLDGYWLGAPTTSLTYRSPGPMYLNLLRVSVEPVLSDLEDVWGFSWLPRGQRVRFDRQQILRDDFKTTMDALAVATGGQPIMSVEEARAYLALPVVKATGGVGASGPSPLDTTEEES